MLNDIQISAEGSLCARAQLKWPSGRLSGATFVCSVTSCCLGKDTEQTALCSKQMAHSFPGRMACSSKSVECQVQGMRRAERLWKCYLGANAGDRKEAKKEDSKIKKSMAARQQVKNIIVARACFVRLSVAPVDLGGAHSIGTLPHVDLRHAR